MVLSFGLVGRVKIAASTTVHEMSRSFSSKKKSVFNASAPLSDCLCTLACNGGSNGDESRNSNSNHNNSNLVIRSYFCSNKSHRRGIDMAQSRLWLRVTSSGFASFSKRKDKRYDLNNSNSKIGNSSNDNSSGSSDSSNSDSNSNSSNSNSNGDTNFVPGPIYSDDNEHYYKTDMKQLRKWLNPHIYQNNGRLFDADRNLLEDKYSKMFPAIKAELLETSKEVIYPDCFPECDVKLVGVSFKGYGQEACKTWMNPFWSAYGSNSRIRSGELFLSEHSILSPLTFMFVNAAKKNIPQERWSTTAVKIGNINDVTVPLLLPNKYSGYMFLLDKKNMIRWRSSGYPTGDEIEMFLKLTQKLLDKPTK